MIPAEARELLAGIAIEPGGVWADLGAGRGLFSRALAERLGAAGVVYAVDRDAAALAELDRTSTGNSARIVPVVADFERQFEAPGANSRRLDGMLFANSLHFLQDAHAVLARLATWLGPGGRVVVIEYDRRGPNPWVPFPIPISSLAGLTEATGLSTPVVVANRPSAYEGQLYVAVSERLPG